MITIRVTGLDELRASLEKRKPTIEEILKAQMDAMLKKCMADPALTRWRPPVDTTTGLLPSMLADGTFYRKK